MGIDLIEIPDLLTPGRAVVGIVAASTLVLLLRERRLALLLLLVQYLLIGLLIGSRLYRPIILVRAGLGVAICMILYITAGHVQDYFSRTNPRPLRRWLRLGWHTIQGGARGDDASLSEPAQQATLADRADMGFIFHLLVVSLGGLVAYGLWRAYSWPFLPTEANLIAYWLMLTGLFSALVGGDPLRVGFGLLTFITDSK